MEQWLLDSRYGFMRCSLVGAYVSAMGKQARRVISLLDEEDGLPHQVKLAKKRLAKLARRD